jgi:hypothetical protein
VIASYRANYAAHPEWAQQLKDVASVEVEYPLGEIPRTLSQSLEGLGRISRIVGSRKEFSHPNAAEKSGENLHKAILSELAPGDVLLADILTVDGTLAVATGATQIQRLKNFASLTPIVEPISVDIPPV